ncbi:NRPS-like enzyme [Aspergillus sclerotialis]|uniref:NRPS-like enzyme n=1 Tax=Aspergillus sclerotialis TaxID=2070753 RepID=A0A3A2Z5P5_9EURO|nr:NRPS-like enzyme [Aspergillus sclerotialis]
MLSLRLSADACVSLLNNVRYTTLLYGYTTTIRSTVGEILRQKPVSCFPIRTDINRAIEDLAPMSLPSQAARVQTSHTAVILHSSGSTSLSKPLYLTHDALVSQMKHGPGLSSFNSLPWFHLYGLTTALQAMYTRNIAFI